MEEIMDGKVGYSFSQLQSEYNKLLEKREDIVNNLGLPVERDNGVINSLVEDLKEISAKIDEFERLVVWTENIHCKWRKN